MTTLTWCKQEEEEGERTWGKEDMKGNVAGGIGKCEWGSSQLK